MQFVRNHKEKELRRVLDDLKQSMANFPDGKITDLISANAVYEQMNRVVDLATKLGYTSEEILEMLESCNCSPALKPVAAKVSGHNKQF